VKFSELKSTVKRWNMCNFLWTREVIIPHRSRRCLRRRHHHNHHLLLNVFNLEVTEPVPLKFKMFLIWPLSALSGSFFRVIHLFPCIGHQMWWWQRHLNPLAGWSLLHNIFSLVSFHWACSDLQMFKPLPTSSAGSLEHPSPLIKTLYRTEIY